MTLIQFPADRRAADIKRCAQALLQIHGDEANRFWRHEMAAFAARLRAQQVADAEISHQAGLFMHAVQMELQDLFGRQDREVSVG